MRQSDRSPESPRPGPARLGELGANAHCRRPPGDGRSRDDRSRYDNHGARRLAADWRRQTTDDSSMAAAARRLAEAAGAFRAEVETPRDGSDFAMSFSHVEVALGDLAAGAELSAYAVTAAERPDGVSATHAPPTSAARSPSWRLHGLRRELLDAREVCAEVSRVLRPVAGD